MHPYLLHIPLPWGGSFALPAYGTSILIGFLTCLWLVQKRARRMGLEPASMFDLAVFALLGGILGARLFYIIHHWETYAGQGLRALFPVPLTGLSFFGGLIGGTVASILTTWWKKLPPRATLDVAASLIPLGHAFGRLGCFLNGCCYGKITDAWVGLRFPRVLGEEGMIVGSLPYLDHLERGLISEAHTHSLPVHPTQLYAIVYLLVIFAFTSWLLPRRRRAGDVAWTYAILYGAARFTNEFFRADTAPLPGLGPLSLFNLIAAAAVVFGAAMLLRSLTKPAEPRFLTG